MEALESEFVEDVNPSINPEAGGTEDPPPSKNGDQPPAKKGTCILMNMHAYTRDLV